MEEAQEKITQLPWKRGKDGKPTFRSPEHRLILWGVVSGGEPLLAYDRREPESGKWETFEEWGTVDQMTAANIAFRRTYEDAMTMGALNADERHPQGSITAIAYAQPSLGDPISAQDADGRWLHIGDRVRTDEGGWEGYITSYTSCEDGKGGFSDAVDWERCHTLTPWDGLE